MKKRFPLTINAFTIIQQTARLIPLLLLLVCGPFTIEAGEIALDNGEQIRGRLIRINREKIRWESPSIGKINIPKRHIVAINSEIPLKLRGVKTPCFLSGLDNGNAYFVCEDDTVTQQPFLLVEDVLPFDEAESYFEQWGKLAIVGNQASGNKRNRNWEVDARTTLKGEIFRHILSVEYDGKRNSDEDPTDEEYDGQYTFRWDFSPQTFWFASGAIEANEARKIQERYTFGTGIGFQFWEQRNSAFSIEWGFEYVDELTEANEDTSIDEHQEFASTTLGSTYRFRVARDIILFNENAFVQSLQDSAEWNIKSVTGLTIPIIQRVTTDLKYEYFYDNNPAENTLKRDSQFRFGLGYQW